jgi:hypothetical protein
MHFLTRTILVVVCLAVSSGGFYAQANGGEGVSPCNVHSPNPVPAQINSRKTPEIIDEYLDGRFMDWKQEKPFLFSTSKYDRKGRLVEDNNYRSDGAPMAKSISFYDDNNRLIKSNVLSAVTQKPYLETRYIYNEDGTLKEMTGVSLDDNTILSKTVYNYNREKNYLETIESKSYTKDLNRYRYSISPDKCGNTETYYYGRDGNLASRDVYSHDDRANMIFLARYSADGKLLNKFKYQYEFDSEGSWTRKSTFEWKTENRKAKWKLVDVTYHKIKYFDTK